MSLEFEDRREIVKYRIEKATLMSKVIWLLNVTNSLF